jgi:hypothetical protein
MLQLVLDGAALAVVALVAGSATGSKVVVVVVGRIAAAARLALAAHGHERGHVFRRHQRLEVVHTALQRMHTCTKHA